MTGRGKWRRRWGVAVGLGLAGLLLAGCGRPRAPVLEDSPVYQNDREGFRFLVPEGWIMTARADVPPGRAEKERLLVQYRRREGGEVATLEVSLADLPAGTDLAAYLEGPAYDVEHWHRRGEAEAVDVGGVPAVRLAFIGRSEGKELAKEVTGFPRGSRTYFFTAVYFPGDASAPEQVRRAVASTIWR